MITVEDVRRLRDATQDHPVLVVLYGRAMVVDATELESEQYRGAFVLAARSDLSSDEMSARELEEVAADLDVRIATQGG